MKARMEFAARVFATGALGGYMTCAAALAQPSTAAPAPHITAEDFIRSDRFLLGKPEMDILNGDIAFQWIDEGNTFYYRSQSVGGTRYLLVDSATGSKNLLFDHQAMAQALGRALNIAVKAEALPVDRLIRLSKDRYRLTSDKRTLLCDLAVGRCREEHKDKEITATPSPDGRHMLFSRDYNIWLKDNGSGEERPLTQDGVRGWSYGRPPESSTTEISDRRSGEAPPVAALWSPDGRRFVSYRLDERHVKELALVQAIAEDGSFRPKLHTYYYDMPGEKPPEAAFFVYDIEKGARTPINYRALPSSTRVPMVLSHLWWSADASTLYVLDAPLTQPFMKLLEINPGNGAVRQLLEERADTTYFPNASRTGPPSIRILKNGDIVWFSERDGWGHVYLYNGKTGKLKNAITQGEWLVRDIEHIDEREGYIYLTGSAREKGESIYNRHLYRVKLDGTGLKLLTPEPGDHDFPSVIHPLIATLSPIGKSMQTVPRISPNGAYIIDHFSTVMAPGHWVLRRKDGSIVARLEDEDASRLPPYTVPEPFKVKSADGRYDLYGVLSKPANFDPTKRYAVIDHIYPGPQIITAPSTFGGGGNPVFGGAIFGESQALADLGFVVIQVDGRGGPYRSKAFRDLSYRNMDKAGMLEDHVAAIRALARTRPWLDITRVGIFGTSGGGFATGRAMIDFPDFFKVGVSSAGNHEQRSYIRIWGETYHGPLDSTDYDTVFAGNAASRFKGKLLLAHGEMDDNVHPAQTLRLADALIKANKQFDMLIMPNVEHGIARTPYFRRITQNYFLRHLMGAQLPSESAIVQPRVP